MLWTDWGDLRPGIYRSDMDGSAVRSLVSEDVKWPNGIAVDEQWVYWTDAYLDCIERVSLHGQQRSVLLGGLPHPYAIAVFKVGLPHALPVPCMTGRLGFCREASLTSRRDSFPNLRLFVSAHSEGCRQVPGAWFQLRPASLGSFAPASVWPPRSLYLWGRPPRMDSVE